MAPQKNRGKHTGKDQESKARQAIKRKLAKKLWQQEREKSRTQKEATHSVYGATHQPDVDELTAANLCPCGFYMQKCKDHRCDEYHCPNVFCNCCPCFTNAYKKVPPSWRWLFVVFHLIKSDCCDEDRPRQFAPPNLPRESNDPFDISIVKFMQDPSSDKPCLCRFFLENICYFLGDLVKLPGLQKMQQHQGVMCSLVSFVKAKLAYHRWLNQEKDLAEFVKLLHIYRN